MNFFRRRSSVDLGRFEAPVAAPVAPISHVVDEGVMITRSAVRMAVKNRMIVAALRDGLSYDHAEFMHAAAEQFADFAAHEEESAKRVRERREAPNDTTPDSERREEIHTGLGLAFREIELDVAALDAILTEARDDALAEIAKHLRTASSDESSVIVDEAYATGKNDRVAALLYIDLAELAENHGTSLAELEEN